MMSEKQRFEITDYGSEYYIEIIDNKKELDKNIDNPTQRLDLVECCGSCDLNWKLINILFGVQEKQKRKLINWQIVLQMKLKKMDY